MKPATTRAKYDEPEPARDSDQVLTDMELNLTSPPTDLHSLRSVNPDLDERANLIQQSAVKLAVEDILTNEPLASEIKSKKILITGGAGYLGATLAATLRSLGANVVTIDVVSPQKQKEKDCFVRQRVDVVGSVEDGELLTKISFDCDVIFNTAALHAPYATSRHENEFVSVNIGGIKNILENTKVPIIIQTSTTSLTITENVKEREKNNECVWLDETANSSSNTGNNSTNLIVDEKEMPRNKYGRTKKEAERLCMLAASSSLSSLASLASSSSNQQRSIVILRTSRFFCEDLLEGSSSNHISLANSMANELLGRRAALVDIVIGHIKAMLRAKVLSGNTYVLSCPWPFTKEETPLWSSVEVANLIKARYGANVYRDAITSSMAMDPTPTSTCSTSAAATATDFDSSQINNSKVYGDFVLPTRISRIYDSSASCRDLDWKPLWTFETLIEKLKVGDEDALLGRF